MKTKMNFMKASLLGLAIMLSSGMLLAQSGKDVIKGDQKSGKDIIKGDQKSGKDSIKGDPKGGKDDVKNGTDNTGTGTVEGGTGHTGTGHTGTGTAEGGTGTVEGGSESAPAATYLREKGNEDKPYDQARLDGARNKCKDMIAAAEASLATEDQHVQTAKARVQTAMDAVAAMKAEKKPDQAAITAKEEAIRMANEKIAALELQIIDGKAAVERAKVLITPPPAAAAK